ncbi:hypothetical protein [Acinetobacter sp. WCHAc060025]|uniref:hypothetical protein n=1 Tax=Acinetobacter sp. WCHAc060025 TaxID=2518625 RepID=UPI001023AB1B|nr:hypothetical protein [Acinetobacter sp. WCHAc060025]RZG76706.1 hypothetical protein EXE09_06655 [Acinetobacter sp. WCHAc060025]
MIYFIVPHNQNAVEKDNYGIMDQEIMTIVPLEREKIDMLWKIGYFNDLNNKFNLLIDETEEEIISGEKCLEDALKFTIGYIEKYPDVEYLHLIKSLLDEALNYKTQLNLYL